MTYKEVYNKIKENIAEGDLIRIIRIISVIIVLVIFFVFICSCQDVSVKQVITDCFERYIETDISSNLYAVPIMNFKRLQEDTEVSPSAKSIGMQTITMSFVGDCMLASFKGEYNWNTFNYRADQEDPTYFFAEVAEIFKNDSFTVANCENVFTDNELKEADKSHDIAYWYKSKSANASIFKVGGIDIISLANNHIYDYGGQGREDTITAAEAAGLLWGDDYNPVFLEKYGFKITLLCVNIMNSRNIDLLFASLEEFDEFSDFIIVYFHGGIERIYEPPEYIVETARRMVDAGADLVIGHHPHVLQPIERYKGVNIVYSLGNFLFGAGRGENRTIIYQYNIIVADGMLMDAYETIIPCYCFVDRWQPTVIKDEEIKKQVIDFLNSKAEKPL